mgnify:CR=1 FL=1
MKQKRGVTMISLVITIIVIILLVTIVLSTGMLGIFEAQNTKNDMEVRNLKDAVANRMIQNEKNPEKYPLVGNKIDDLAEFLNYADNLSGEEIERITKNLTTERLEYYRIIDGNAATSLGVRSVASSHYYIIDYLTGNVYGCIDIEKMSSEVTGEWWEINIWKIIEE